MSFTRVLNFTLSLVLLIVFTGVLTGRLVNLLDFIEHQTAAHAQDTATSLALSLGPAFAAKDRAKVEAMVDAVFDRGSYREVTVQDMDGNPIVVRQASLELAGIPMWLPKHIAIDTPIMDAVAMDGWRQAGHVRVAVHPINAYKELWNNGRQLVEWFVGAWLTSSILVLILSRWMLNPLHALELQALSLAEQRFPTPVKLPATRELRRVATAMNLMTERLRDAFHQQASSLETWRNHAFCDLLTGLDNQASLENHLRQLAEDIEASEGGALILLKVTGLSLYNHLYGRAKGDELLQRLAQYLREIDCVPPSTRLPFRLEGATFALLLCGVGAALANSIVRDIAGKMFLCLAGFNTPEPLSVFSGIAVYRGQPAKEWLAEADGCMQQAMASNVRAWSVPQDVKGMSSCPGENEWMSWLEEVLKRRDLHLRFQPVFSAFDSHVLLHHEVYVRFPCVDGELHPASRVLPMLYGSGKMEQLDRLVVDLVIEQLLQHPHLRQYKFAVNLSQASLMSRDWTGETMAALERTALQDNLLFEVPEGVVLADPENIGQAVMRLRSVGVGFGIDRFGAGHGQFRYLASVKPDYVKIDGGFSLNLETHFENQFYVQSLVGIARGLGITVIACALERPEDAEVMKHLQVDGMQGNYFGAASLTPIEC